jgi:hypothetical protein
VAEKNKTLEKFFEGMAKNLSRKYIKKKEKERLLSITDTLDIKAESNPLSLSDREN